MRRKRERLSSNWLRLARCVIEILKYHRMKKHKRLTAIEKIIFSPQDEIKINDLCWRLYDWQIFTSWKSLSDHSMSDWKKKSIKKTFFDERVSQLSYFHRSFDMIKSLILWLIMLIQSSILTDLDVTEEPSS